MSTALTGQVIIGTVNMLSNVQQLVLFLIWVKMGKLLKVVEKHVVVFHILLLYYI